MRIGDRVSILPTSERGTITGTSGTVKNPRYIVCPDPTGADLIPYGSARMMEPDYGSEELAPLEDDD